MPRISHQILLGAASRIAVVAAAGLLAGCSGTNLFASSAKSSSEFTKPEANDVLGGAAYWGAKYDANRNDIEAAVSFAKNLRMMGGSKQAVTLLKDIVMKAPDNPKVLSEYGKALTAVGRSKDALPFFARAIQLKSGDWTTLSAYGVALDQVGDHAAAQANYQAALELSAGNPSVESNLAMSYILDGKLAQADSILRKLVARADATPQMRQNLAMVASLQGNKLEAERLAREDLTPNETVNNLSVLQQFSATNAKSVPVNSAPAKPTNVEPTKLVPPPVRKTPPADNTSSLVAPQPAKAVSSISFPPLKAPTKIIGETLPPPPSALRAAQGSESAEVPAIQTVPRPAPIPPRNSRAVMAPIPDEAETPKPAPAPVRVATPAPAPSPVVAPAPAPEPQPAPAQSSEQKFTPVLMKAPAREKEKVEGIKDSTLRLRTTYDPDQSHGVITVATAVD